MRTKMMSNFGVHRALVLVVALLSQLGSAAQTAEPLLEKTVLFEAGKGGYESYRIPCLVVTGQGALLAFCEARRGTRGDWGAIDILLRRGTESGKTWSAPQKIATLAGPHQKNPVAVKQNLAGSDEVTYNNPLTIVDAGSGAVHFLFCLEYMRAFYQRSDDDGRSFTKPVEITAGFDEFRKRYAWQVLATGPGHGIQLQSGRLLAPVWLSTGSGGHAHRPSVAATIYSDDHGRSWHAGDIVAGETDELTNPSEAMAVQLADGRVMLNMRHESPAHRRAVALSGDGATKWSKPAFDEQLLEPLCMASMCRLSEQARGGKNRILFANPDNLERADGQAIAGRGRDRKNLTVKLSYSEGQSWPVSKPLEAGPSGYSDLAVGPDRTIYCLYEQPGQQAANARQQSLTLARFNLEWLTDGRDSTNE